MRLENRKYIKVLNGSVKLSVEIILSSLVIIYPDLIMEMWSQLFYWHFGTKEGSSSVRFIIYPVSKVISAL